MIWKPLKDSFKDVSHLFDPLPNYAVRVERIRVKLALTEEPIDKFLLEQELEYYKKQAYEQSTSHPRDP